MLKMPVQDALGARRRACGLSSVRPCTWAPCGHRVGTVLHSGLGEAHMPSSALVQGGQECGNCGQDLVAFPLVAETKPFLLGTLPSETACGSWHKPDLPPPPPSCCSSSAGPGVSGRDGQVKGGDRQWGPGGLEGGCGLPASFTSFPFPLCLFISLSSPLVLGVRVWVPMREGGTRRKRGFGGVPSQRHKAASASSSSPAGWFNASFLGFQLSDGLNVTSLLIMSQPLCT